MKKIIVTGGHLTPALAVIAELQKNGWQIIFFGRKYALEGDSTLSAEYSVIKELGISFVSINAGRLQRSFTRYTIFSFLKIPVGFIQSFYWLIRLRPKVIISFGSYVALPVALAGWLLRIPVITHEQSVVPGLATKIISRVVRKICLSWPETLQYFPNNKVVLTGNPIRKEVFENISTSTFHISNENLPLIYITGGNLGAHLINKVVAQILPKLLVKYRIVHQSGDSQIYKDYEKLLATSCQLPADLKNRYYLAKYVDAHEIGWVLNNANLIISRSGANIVSELAALGKPAILIPLPWAGQQEQLENAKLLAEAGTAIILPQEKLNGESLYRSINTMIQEIEKYKKKADKAKRLVKLNAANRLVETINEVIHETE